VGDIIDPASRLKKLIAKQSPRFASGFQLLISQIKDSLDLTEIADLLETGRLEQALTAALRRAPRLGNLYMDSFVAAARDTASFLNRNLETIVIDFDQTNPFAVQVARENQLRLVREFSQSQAKATREAILEGIKTGANPKAQAAAFKDSIGLTEKQVKAVENYRRQLEVGDRGIFDRALRDKRFDSVVRTAIAEGKPLSRSQINKMVDRYREKYVAYRSRVIARTEALRSVHQGNHQMYLQAIENGDLDANSLMNEWNTSLRENVRDSHKDMHGQKRPFGEMFVSGRGNTALHPGAFNVQEEDIQCVCNVGTRITEVTAPAGVTVEFLS
jgi:hypothetical protein